VIAFTTPYLWYSSRATGIVSLVLLTVMIVLGALVSTRVGGRAVGRFEINEIHRSISMITMLFVVVHVGTTVVDSYVPIGFFSALVPFTSGYRRIPVAIGTIAIDLMLTVWVSSLVKDRIRNVTWRYLHWLSWGCFAAAALHGFLVGSDSHRPWMIILQAVCVAAVIMAAIWRITQRPTRAAGRTAHSPLAGSGQVATKKTSPTSGPRPLAKTGGRAIPPSAPLAKGPRR